MNQIKKFKIRSKFKVKVNNKIKSKHSEMSELICNVCCYDRGQNVAVCDVTQKTT